MYFNPRSPCGERLVRLFFCYHKSDFNPRSPCGERRCRYSRSRQQPGYFNPRSPCGERPLPDTQPSALLPFQSTLPVWGATAFPACPAQKFPDFNPRSPCGERPKILSTSVKDVPISIHAPRVGSDMDPSQMIASRFLFQSTLPVWGATIERVA